MYMTDRLVRYGLLKKQGPCTVKRTPLAGFIRLLGESSKQLHTVAQLGVLELPRLDCPYGIASHLAIPLPEMHIVGTRCN